MFSSGGIYAEGRAAKAINLHHINKQIRQVQAEIKDLKNHDVVHDHVVTEDMLDKIQHNFESYLCDAEFEVMCKMDEFVAGWKDGQCGQMGLSRRALLRAAAR